MFISPAFAQTATDTAEATGGPSLLVSMAPLVLIFVVFYFIVIRPQNRRIIEHRKMVNNLTKGDKVVTGGGLHATVKKLVGEEDVVLDLGGGVEVTAMRHSLMLVRDSAAAKAAAAVKNGNDKIAK
ncbi:MAG: preprotein translocase subunit YajC [Alphaproteobacteria bacterium]|nr:preprotein translocase subunit YajC [Alphaproteobacteria bacterium]